MNLLVMKKIPRPMFKDAQCHNLYNLKWLDERAVNIASSTSL